MTSQIKLSSGFSSRTYAYALTKVFDSGFMGSVAIDFEKVRRSKTKKKDKKGEVRNHSIAFRVATDAIEYFFIDLMFQECEFYKYQPYDADWLIDDVLEAVSPFISDRQMTKVFDVICEPYFSAIRSLSADEHFSEKNMALACETCCRLVRAIYSNRKYRLIKEAYANEIADRILHDRQIASVISDYVSRYAKLKNGQPSPVARLRWPSNVKRILFARDRGKCAMPIPTLPAPEPKTSRDQRDEFDVR